jgi:hypothetical protein
MDIFLVVIGEVPRRRKTMRLASVVCMSLLVWRIKTFRSTATKDLADNISNRSLPLA